VTKRSYRQVALGEIVGRKRPATRTTKPRALTGTSASDSSGSGISISIPASSPEALQPIVPFSPLGKRARPSYSPLSYAAAGTDSPQGPFVCYICHGVEGSPEALLQCHDAECTDPHAYYHVNCVHDMDIGTKFYCAACTQARDLGRGCEEGGSDQSFPGSRFQDSQNPRFQVPRFPLKRSPGPPYPPVPWSPFVGRGGEDEQGGWKEGPAPLLPHSHASPWYRPAPLEPEQRHKCTQRRADAETAAEAPFLVQMSGRQTKRGERIPGAPPAASNLVHTPRNHTSRPP